MCVRACVYVCVRAFLCVCVCVCVCACLSIYIHIYIDMCVCACARASLYFASFLSIPPTSGAYNRTLTPFGFQHERRSLWSAPTLYSSLSPFHHAHRIAHTQRPLLLFHGDCDENRGTWVEQSRRLYEAMKGLGGACRYVELPGEGHHYHTRRAYLHVLWEMEQFIARTVLPPLPQKQRLTSRL